MSASAQLFAFPLSRRRELVRKLAGQMLERSPVEAEKHLASELRRHRRLLTRKQLSEAAVEVQLRALQGAARAELRRLVMLPPLREICHRGKAPARD
jgi:hypothetical protein